MSRTWFGAPVLTVIRNPREAKSANYSGFYIKLWSCGLNRDLSGLTLGSGLEV